MQGGVPAPAAALLPAVLHTPLLLHWLLLTSAIGRICQFELPAVKKLIPLCCSQVCHNGIILLMRCMFNTITYPITGLIKNNLTVSTAPLLHPYFSIRFLKISLCEQERVSGPQKFSKLHSYICMHTHVGFFKILYI